MPSKDIHKRREAVKRVRDKRTALKTSFKNVPCMDCGIQYPPYVMDFDHRDRSTKLFEVGGAVTYSVEKLVAEIDKCDVVCANCHRERTFNRT